MSFSFSTPSSAPATTGLTGGFSFGANKPATPGFGLTATSQPSTGLFATPAAGTAAPALGNTSFGVAATPGFGATGTSSAAPAFGATSTAPSFGAATPGFGAAASGFAPAAVSAAPAFGAISTPAPAFGANTTAPAFGAGGLNFGTGTSTAAPSTGLSFGQPAATTAAGLGGFNIGGTAAPSTGLGFGIGTATTTSSLFGKSDTTTVTGSLPSTTGTVSFLGLGGTAPTSGIGSASAAANAKDEPAKQQKLPNEISTTVTSFMEFVKKQKALSSEVMRVSVKPLYSVASDAETILRETACLRGDVVRGRAASRRLRAAAAAALHAAEPRADAACAGSELDGSAPPLYVKELISELEQQLITFRRQMDIADKQMQSSPKLLTEQELNLGFRRMHESLVGLAARLQAAHAQVEAQKEQYLNLRKYVLKDPTDVFDTAHQTSMLDQILKDVDSSRKKGKASGLLDGSAVLTDPKAALGVNLSQLAGPTPFNYMGGGVSHFPLQDSTGPSWQPQASAVASTQAAAGVSFTRTDSDTSFQLQRPPGKRGKQ